MRELPVALDVHGMRVMARRVTVVISDDGRVSTDGATPISRQDRRRAAALGPPLIKADVLELQQSRDGRDHAYVCRGRVEIQRGSMRATTSALTMDVSAHTMLLGPCRLGWGPTAGPHRWTLAGLAQIARRSRVSAKSCRVSLRTGDVLCGDARAYLPGYACSEWDHGTNRIRADELSLRFPASGPTMSPRVEASGFTWLPRSSPPANSPHPAERTSAGLGRAGHKAGGAGALGLDKARWSLHNERPAASWVAHRLPGLAGSVTNTADLEELPKPAVRKSAAPHGSARRLTVRTAPTGRSIALRVPLLSTRTAVSARLSPAVRAVVSVRVRVPRAANGQAASAALRAKWGGARGASLVATGGLHLLREHTPAVPDFKVAKATKAAAARIAATAASTPSAMARELVLGRTTSFREASLGPLPMSVGPAGGASLGADAVTTSASSPRSVLERFKWRVQLPVGDHRMTLDGTQVRLERAFALRKLVVFSPIFLLRRSGCALVWGHSGWRFSAVVPAALRSKSCGLVVLTWSRRLPCGWAARRAARPPRAQAHACGAEMHHRARAPRTGGQTVARACTYEAHPGAAAATARGEAGVAARGAAAGRLRVALPRLHS